MPIRPFHLAIPVTDLEAAREFYTKTFGCRTGREADRWIDLDFYGHQLVVHLVSENQSRGESHENPVDNKQVPSSHFGPILGWDQFWTLADRLTKSGMDFVIEPYIRFEGEPSEQATMFFRDPSGNAIEVKAFRDLSMLFAK